MIRSALLAAAALLAGVPHHALAIDYSKVDPPAPVTDRQVGIANRIVKLPLGTWTYIAGTKSRATFTTSLGAGTATHSGYFVDVSGSVFRVGVAIELPEQAMPATSWHDEPCKDEGKIFKSTLNGSVLLPECLLVNRRDTHLKGARDAFYGSAASWLETSNVSFGGPVYDIFYSRYSGTGHGRIRVFVPVGAFPDERAAIEWAKGIPPRFKEFIEWRESTASLPALPASDEFDNKQSLQKSSSPTVSTASLPALPASTDFDSKQPLQKSSSPTATRSLAVSWEGYSRLIPGTVEIQDEGKRGKVLAPLPNSEGECTGVYEMIDRRNGQWALACTNGLSATGKLEAFGQGKGSSGIGVDTKGRRVEFSVGGASNASTEIPKTVAIPVLSPVPAGDGSNTSGEAATTPEVGQAAPSSVNGFPVQNFGNAVQIADDHPFYGKDPRALTSAQTYPSAPSGFRKAAKAYCRVVDRKDLPAGYMTDGSNVEKTGSLNDQEIDRLYASVRSASGSANLSDDQLADSIGLACHAQDIQHRNNLKNKK